MIDFKRNWFYCNFENYIIIINKQFYVSKDCLWVINKVMLNVCMIRSIDDLDGLVQDIVIFFIVMLKYIFIFRKGFCYFVFNIYVYLVFFF